MSKELEAFKDIKEIIDDLPVGLFDIIEDYDDKYDDDENEPMNLIKQALQELEELKSKVKRYFELQSDFPIFTREEYGEHNQLCRELRKVGEDDE